MGLPEVLERNERVEWTADEPGELQIAPARSWERAKELAWGRTKRQTRRILLPLWMVIFGLWLLPAFLGMASRGAFFVVLALCGLGWAVTGGVSLVMALQEQAPLLARDTLRVADGHLTVQRCWPWRTKGFEVPVEDYEFVDSFRREGAELPVDYGSGVGWEVTVVTGGPMLTVGYPLNGWEAEALTEWIDERVRP